MRFLVAADNFTRGSGGAPRSAQEMTRALIAAGHEVAIIECGRRAEKTQWEGTQLYRARLHGPLMPADRDIRTLLLNPRWRTEVLSLIRAFRPRLVVTQGMLAPGATEAARIERVPTAYLFRGYAPFCPVHFAGRDPERDCSRPDCRSCLSFVGKLKYTIVRKVLDLYERTVPQAELVVANSNYIAGLFDKFWQVKAETVYPEAGIEPAAAPENNPDGPLLFVKPQRIKGVELIAALARRMPDREFAVAGELGGSAARALGNLSNVEMLGWREDMAAVYRDARLLLGPSRLPEPFGRVFAEAAAVGCPSIAFKVGGIPEAVGGGGLLLDPDSGVERWAAAVAEADDAGLYESLRAAALANARKLASTGGKLVSLLEETARSGARPRPEPPVPDRKLKVVQVINSLNTGGAVSVVREIAGRLDRAKFDVRVVVLHKEGTGAESFREAGIPVELVWMPGRYSPRGLWRLARQLAGADVVHTHLRRANTSGRIAAWLAGVPVVLTHHHSLGTDLKPRHFLTERFLSPLSTAVLAVSGPVAERHARLGRVRPERFRIVSNGVDTDRFRPGNREKARAVLGIDADKFVVGYAGRLNHGKGLKLTLDAAAEAAREIPALKLLLVGDGPMRAELEARAEEPDLAGRVMFPGNRDDMSGVYPAMDVLSLASESEGDSMVLLEAAACGLPLIATSTGTAPALLGEDAGLLVPIGEAGPLAEAMVKLGRDSGLRDKMGQAARRAAEARGLDNYVKNIERLYLELWATREK